MQPAVLRISSLKEEDLLNLYLSSTPEERGKLFAPTARIAERLGVTQRTVQYWIENGSIQSIQIGHRRFVYLKSLGSFLTRNLSS